MTPYYDYNIVTTYQYNNIYQPILQQITKYIFKKKKNIQEHNIYIYSWNMLKHVETCWNKYRIL